MSTIAIQNIRRTGETASRDARGVAASWLNMNGTGTIVIRDSVNVASLVDRGVGLYDYNLTSLMANADYAILGANSDNGASANVGFATLQNSATATTGKVPVYVYVSNTGAAADTPFCNASTMGDMA